MKNDNGREGLMKLLTQLGLINDVQAHNGCCALDTIWKLIEEDEEGGDKQASLALHLFIIYLAAELDPEGFQNAIVNTVKTIRPGAKVEVMHIHATSEKRH